MQTVPRLSRSSRRLRLLAVVGVAVTSMALTGTGVPAEADPGVTTSTVVPVGAHLRTITYAGLSVKVPVAWPVIDLATTPKACVRVDRHAVYLGTPAADQNCPARIVGHTEAILLTPAAALQGTEAAAAATPTAVGTMPALTTRSRQSGQFAQTFRAARVTALASFGAHPKTMQAVLASIKQVAASPLPVTAARQGQPNSMGLTDKTDYSNVSTGTHFTGMGFDTCATPSAAAMRAWRSSPYRSVGVYLGGLNRACLWGNLSPTWVTSVARMGWRLQPIYVGLQPYCTNQRGMADISKDTTTASAQGRNEAADAVSRAKLLGLYQGSTLYSDIEGYNTYDATCVASTMAYLDGFVRALHDRGYLAGVYSSAYSAIQNLAQRYSSPTQARPDSVWTARWDGVATTDEKVLTSGQWSYQARAKQYRGDHTATNGGYSIRIDSNYLDTMVASVSYDYQVEKELHVWTAPTTLSSVVRSIPLGSTVRILCQARGKYIYGDNVWNKLTDGRWISDRRVTTSSATGYSSPLPKCTFVYQTWRNPLALHTGPVASARVVGWRPVGSLTHTVCQMMGSLVGDTHVWDKLQDGAWIADYNLANGMTFWNPNVPRCP
jgi:hypothetical protein